MCLIKLISLTYDLFGNFSINGIKNMYITTQT